MTYEFIENKTLREYYEKEGIELSDEAKAWLMYRVSGYERRWKYLYELAQSTTDPKLREQISEDYQRSVRAVEEFKNTNDDPTILYQYTAYNDKPSVDEVRIFSSFDNAINYAKSSFEGCKGFRFMITKLRPDSEDCISNALYSDTFELEDIFPEMYMGNSKIYNTLPRIPIPYRRGDIVKFTNKSMDGYYGVLLDPEDSVDDWYDYIEKDQGSMFHAEPCLWVLSMSVDASDIDTHQEDLLQIELVDLESVVGVEKQMLPLFSLFVERCKDFADSDLTAALLGCK